MGYKTILVHCNHRQRLPRLLAPAINLCAAFGARLVGVSVAPPVARVPAGMPGTPDTIIIDEHANAYRAENQEMKVAFEEAAYTHNIEPVWREADAASSSVAHVVRRHARSADLVIASQVAPGWRGSRELDVPDKLVMETGRPVLIVPNAGSHDPIPKRIVVGWTDRREAARALFDALPLLKRAETVTIVEIDAEPGPEEMENRTALCANLAQHGIRGEVETAQSRHGNVGDALLACCERAHANLLVMGCYGHSRLHEFVLGGATRHVLAGMTLPVLMSH